MKTNKNNRQQKPPQMAHVGFFSPCWLIARRSNKKPTQAKCSKKGGIPNGQERVNNKRI